MPRNPRKTRCQVPGCRSWAMRSHTRCRSHRDHELGLRGGGAPLRNINALKTGNHAHPISLPDLDNLAGQIIRQPEQLPEHIKGIVRSIQDRTPDPYKTLIAFQSTLSNLTSLVAKCLFAAEVDTLLRETPPSQRTSLFRTINTTFRYQEPETALRTLRGLTTELENRQKKASIATIPHSTASDHDHQCQRQDPVRHDD